MFENITHFFKRFRKSEKEESRCTAKERLHLVLAQDRANISADFLEMMKQEILDVIKKYIDIDEKAIDVRLTNKEGEDGSVGAPALYANIPIITIKNEARKLEGVLGKNKTKNEDKSINDTKNEETTNDVNLDKKSSDEVSKQEEKILEESVKEISEEKSLKNVQIEEETSANEEKDDNQQEKLDSDKINEVDNEEKNS